MMPDLLVAAAFLVMATVAGGLIRVLRGPAAADRVMAAQLLGTGGIAALLLAGAATATPGLTDLALVLALLAAFASVALVRAVLARRAQDPPGQAGSVAGPPP
jgi:multicomponent Na+:H+ antiporter subunit F